MRGAMDASLPWELKDKDEAREHLILGGLADLPVSSGSVKKRRGKDIRRASVLSVFWRAGIGYAGPD